MEDAELSRKIRARQIDDFEKWMDIYSGDIERFTIQCGYGLKKAAKVTEEAFRIVFNQLESVDDERSLIDALYKQTVNILANTRRSNQPNETIFLFEEDQELHNQIGQLETDKKVPFILSAFHKLDETEIATIMDTSVEAVELAITEASSDLEVAQLEKRLEFLTRSYGRLKTSFRKEQVFAEPRREVQEPGKVKQTISKKVLISWIAGCLVLLSLLIVPVVTSEEYKKASAEKYIERLKASFEKEVGNRYNELGLKETTEDGVEFNHIFYGKQERDDFVSMIRRYEGDIRNTGTLDKKKVGEEYAKIIKSLELPSAMTKRLFKQPLADDVEKSGEFIKEYLEQYYILQQSYFTVLVKYEQLIEDAVVDGVIDIEEFLKKKETYPKDLQLALDGMIKQNIYPMSVKNWAPIVPVFKKNENSAKIRSSIHPDLRGYLTGLESMPMVTYPGLAHPLEQSIDYLLEIEKTLLATKLTDEATSNLSWSYGELFYKIIGGMEPDRILDTDGKVKTEIRAGWERIAGSGEGSPTAYLMQTIISEMEATNWTESQSRNRLEAYDVYHALELAKAGKLDAFSMLGIRQSASGIESVSLPDTYFENSVEETYHSFSSGYDQSVLQEVSPLVLIGVFIYANEQEDPETMWQLYSGKYNTVTLEEYTAEWSRLELAIDSFDSLLFDGNGGTTGSIGFQRGDTTVYSVQMVLDEDYVWGIQHVDLDFLLTELSAGQL